MIARLCLGRVAFTTRSHLRIVLATAAGSEASSWRASRWTRPFIPARTFARSGTASASKRASTLSSARSSEARVRPTPPTPRMATLITEARGPGGSYLFRAEFAEESEAHGGRTARRRGSRPRAERTRSPSNDRLEERVGRLPHGHMPDVGEDRPLERSLMRARPRGLRDRDERVRGPVDDEDGAGERLEDARTIRPGRHRGEPRDRPVGARPHDLRPHAVAQAGIRSGAQELIRKGRQEGLGTARADLRHRLESPPPGRVRIRVGAGRDEGEAGHEVRIQVREGERDIAAEAVSRDGYGAPAEGSEEACDRVGIGLRGGRVLIERGTVSEAGQVRGDHAEPARSEAGSDVPPDRRAEGPSVARGRWAPL